MSRTFVCTAAIVTAVASNGCSGPSPSAQSGAGGDSGTGDDGASSSDAGGDAAVTQDAETGAMNCRIEVTPPIGTYTSSKSISDCVCGSSTSQSCNTPLVVQATGWESSVPGRVMDLQFQPAGGSFTSVPEIVFATVFGPTVPSCQAYATYAQACAQSDGCAGKTTGNNTASGAFAEVYATEADFASAPVGDTKYVYVWAVWGWPPGSSVVTPDAYNPTPVVFRKVCN